MMTDADKALVERLKRKDNWTQQQPYWHERNPDGPQAAVLIKALAQENERLSQAPHVSGYVSLDQFDAAEARAFSVTRLAIPRTAA